MDYTKDSSGGLKLCDYVTLNLEKSDGYASNTTDTFPWFIPNSAYYSDRRSQVSTVEIIAGVLRSSETGGVDNNLLITYEKGGFNHYTTDNERPVIGYYNVLDRPFSKRHGRIIGECQTAGNTPKNYYIRRVKVYRRFDGFNYFEI